MSRYLLKTAELNTYGARLKYSKLLRVIDDCDSSITSNITTVRMRDLRPVQQVFLNTNFVMVIDSMLPKVKISKLVALQKVTLVKHFYWMLHMRT